MNKIIKTIVYCSLSISPALHSQTLLWKGNDFSLQSEKMTLTAVLESLAENYDTPVNIDPTITGIFSGVINPAPPTEILNKLVTQYNLIYYFDGNSLFIYPAASLKSQVIPLQALPANNFLNYLHKRDITAQRSCEVSAIPGINALDVSGVPVCLTRVTQLASMLDAEVTKRRDDVVSMEIYPLKYASAEDARYQYRDQTVVVPGIVSVLRDMNQGAGSATIGSATGLTATPTVATGLPTFSADPRQNAVIIRDRQADIGVYKKLIAQLDKPPKMIEISVTIIDVDAGNVSQLGIDWSVAASLGGGKIAFNSDTGSGNIGGFSTVISNTPDFMLRLNALEKTSRASVLSQPSVVTLNNIQAVLDKNITFYTKLESDKIAKLESVTTGSLLRVTPRLLDEKGKQNIMLSLNIQDGQQNQPISKEEPLPEIQNSEISSQATLQAGQSLLLGGFKQDKQVQAQNKIPILGDIPVLGHLFSNDVNEIHSVVRLFLIKATIVNSGSLHGK